MRAGAAILCACLLSPVYGSDAPRWLKINSPNFELLTDGGDRGGREVIRYFEQVRGFFLQALGLGPQAGPPVRIIVFRSEKEYAPYSPNEFASAFYLGMEDRDYIVLKSAEMEHFPVAVHEYTHLLVKHSGVKTPVWFNEGLSEFYSNLKPMSNKVVVGSVIPTHYALLRHATWIDLPALLAVKHDSPLYNEKSHAGLFYAESWALVHMLYLDKDYRSNLQALLTGIKNGASMEDTFQNAYGKSVERVQKDLESYMRSTTFSASVFNTKLPQKVEQPEVSETNSLEAGLVLAELHASTKSKAAAAREMYNQLARDYPKDWRIEEGLARLSRRETKNNEAMEHYARAVELGSTSARMYLDYGRMLRYYERDGDAVDVLRRATEIDPNNQEARLELAFADVVDDHPADALKQFKLVTRVTPERAFGYYHALAYTYYRLDHKSDATAAAELCRKYANTPEQLERLNQLVTAMKEVSHKLAPDAEAAKLKGDDLERAEGTLKQIDCTGGEIRMQIVSAGKATWFTVEDPADVLVKGPRTFNFACGPQGGQRIRVEYDPPDVVRAIQLSK